MTGSPGGASPADNFAWACCGRWAVDRARFALYSENMAGAASARTFWDIQQEANRFSNVLAALGVMRGERVALLLPQGAEAAAALVACWQMGAVAVPLRRDLGKAALSQALSDAQANVAIIDGLGEQALAAMATGRPRHAIGVGDAQASWARPWHTLRPLASVRYPALAGLADAPALRLDAGSVAVKEFSHADLAASPQAFLEAHHGYPQAGDLFWTPAAWASAAGLLEGLLPAWQCGQPVVAADGEFGAGAAALALIDKYDIRNALLTPAELEAIMAAVPKVNEKYDCRLRTLATGGAAVTESLAAWLQAQLGVTVERILGRER